MADFTCTTAKFSLCDPQRAAIKPRRYHQTITAGQAVFLNTSGEAALAAANATSYLFHGLAMQSRLASEVGDIFEGGLGLGAECAGFEVSGANPSAIVYLSNTYGALASAAGTVIVRVGEVSALTDPDNTHNLRIWPISADVTYR